MTDTKHTPEPWKAVADDDEDFDSEYYIEVVSKRSGHRCQLGSGTFSEEDARHIVACVNACAGMTDPAAEIAALRARIEAYETGSDFIISQAQAAEWHTRLVDEEKENATLRAELEHKDARIRELEAEIAHGVLDATNRMVDARADALAERDEWKARCSEIGAALKMALADHMTEPYLHPLRDGTIEAIKCAIASAAIEEEE